MTLLFGQDQRVAEYVTRQVGCDAFCAPYTTIGVVNRCGEIIGGFVFNNWTGPNVEVSLAGRGAISKGALRAVAHYVFVQLKCRRATAHCKSHNMRAILQAERGGWKREGMHADWFYDDDAVSLGITRASCSWLVNP